MYPKLTESISRQELLTMRENGMTNQEIADGLDISYRTVYRYIGKQPAGLRGYSKKKDSKEVKPKSTKNAENISTLELVYKTEEYQGRFGSYTVFPDKVVLKRAEKETYTKKDFEQYIVELMDIMDHLE